MKSGDRNERHEFTGASAAIYRQLSGFSQSGTKHQQGAALLVWPIADR